ncbi:4-alpha-glucanotransferase [Treponema primitia ZAS-2]|uniref:4-alpha-glucanotransferase n=1 Tax=Treponema primitia (strain ATCC BAA-887 / DSM 12427 / ZAS-2) TaxID=545694 RepID=F5YLM3_TREPZ|nr:4-alpha-glucanotransferase [Treponema primitia]AEF86569.1 4-alpha-glucanotransferase [Treponema primitia ZAS-2]
MSTTAVSPAVQNQRAAGILLAVSSLPSRYGIGTFGQTARQWVDFLKEAGQKYWQILPLGTTGWGDSPYQSFSAFALSSYYVDLDILRDQGLLTSEEIETLPWGQKPNRVYYAAQYFHREKVLREAFARFRENSSARGDPAFTAFQEKHAHWLKDYSLFMALKRRSKGASWLDWEDALRFRDEKTLSRFRDKLAGDIEYHSFVQYQAYTQWESLKAYANSNGVSIIGDIPIYVAMDSADTWANSDLFQLDEQRRPIRVAGCPPDPFSATGQLWGNPLYRWDLLEQSGFAWWISRLRACMALYDVTRIDHFRGFESYYSIPAADRDASGGEWVKGPGLSFINALNRELPGANIIAEDLGYLTPEVRELLRASGYPGMKILQFAFDSRESSDYMPHTFERHCVVYTGTHDNPTTLGWMKTARFEDVVLAREYLGLKDIREGHWAFIRAALSSVANLAVIPMQDYLGLGVNARMNTPSTTGGNNWRWRLQSDALDSGLAKKIERLTRIYGRT